ncbi:MAG: hypothetical protein COB76_07050 [Alphaproteobacteria bacterium]|nr:MAG: hypothetical protein COB76_07050 [Alphaproteobacteria bacterium]
MTHIISLPGSYNDHKAHKTIFNALGATFFITSSAEAVVGEIKKNTPSIILLHYAWMDPYENRMQSDIENTPSAKNIPVIALHGNPKWVQPSVVSQFRKTFNLVGLLPLTAQHSNRRNRARNENGYLTPEPIIQSTLRSLLEQKDTPITPKMFEKAKTIKPQIL